MSEQSFIATRNLDMNWRGQKVKVVRGAVVTMGDGERFATEFADRPDDLILIDATTAAELRAEQARITDQREAAKAKAAAEAKARAEAEAQRQAKRDALLALAREAVQ